MRAYGIPQMCFVIESMIDDICKDLNIDPVDFRLNSFIKKRSYRQGIRTCS